MAKYIHATCFHPTDTKHNAFIKQLYSERVSVMLIVCIHYLVRDKKVGNLIILGADLSSSYHVHYTDRACFYFLVHVL